MLNVGQEELDLPSGVISAVVFPFPCPPTVQWRLVNHRETPEGFSFFKRELHKVGIIQLHVMETDLTLLVCMPAVEQYSSEGGG